MSLEQFFRVRLAKTFKVNQEELTPEFLSEKEREAEYDARPVKGVVIGGYMTPGRFRRFRTAREIDERRSRVEKLVKS